MGIVVPFAALSVYEVRVILSGLTIEAGSKVASLPVSSKQSHFLVPMVAFK